MGWIKSAAGILLAAAVVFSLPQPAKCQTNTRDAYTKQDVRIAMRDGVKLYTVIFTPKDQSRPYPIMLNRTPYSVPYGANRIPRTLGPSAKFDASGYVFVYQDVRGQYMSEGTYVNMRPENAAERGHGATDESTDTYDTIDWLVHNVPNNNGRVGMWGISYPGFYASCGLINAHPALKAVSPQAPIADWFKGDDDHHNGAFLLLDNFAWEYTTGFDNPHSQPSQQGSPGLGGYDSNDAYKFYLALGPLKNANPKYLKHRIPYWDELLEHSDYDAFWQACNILPHLKDVKPAVLVVGGWYDAEDYYGAIKTHERIAHASPQTPLSIVLGPWSHGAWAGGADDHFGDFAFGAATGPTFRDTMELPFFEKYLKDAPVDPPPAASVFDTGTYHWITKSAWPPHDVTQRSLYFQPSGRLAFNRPTAAETISESYVSDPANPVPYTAAVQIERNNYYVSEDQGFAGKRADVLSYSTEPLREEITGMGPIAVDMFVSTSGTDSDYVVKVIDVYPDDDPVAKLRGYERLVRGDVMRGKFRNSFVHPEPFKPNEPTELKFDLLDICHTFKKGHRVMVQIQSSWFPLVDRNPQTFIDISKAGEADFHKATERIYDSGRYPSHISFGVPNGQ